ncbi:hypothetical protein D1007_14248 [Hordeum vulgare]|uniref:Uncharacterized protein n=1 Tax=Hordeum vulgare subsp. vulgare TaxID=112509 RepID=A0A8I6XRA5_HORVV|nr:uncharacterized protein LOC123396212 [Hordeum vulgare subsp. vulgare]KAE8809203.1 hypothetical protein D1007_14248 [Hordeum vulgare]
MSKRPRSRRAGGAPLTPEEQEEQAERDIEEAVQRRLSREFSNLPGQGNRCKRAWTEASMRGTLVAEGQKLIESQSLQKFELKVDCSGKEFKEYIRKRRLHFRKVASYNFGNNIVATPPDDVVTFNMTELMEGDPSVSVLQMLCCDFSGYFTLLRETPDYSQNPKNRYQKDGFLTFAGMKKKMNFPDIFGTIAELEQYNEAYKDVKMVEIFKGFLKRMSDGLRTLNVDKRRAFNPVILALLHLAIFLLGECPRFPESEDFVVANYDRPLSHLSRVTQRLDDLIHIWSFLSKLAFKFFIAMVEFDLHFRESRASFDEARKLMHIALGKGGEAALELDDNLNLKTLQLDFCGADGKFNLRTLLGSYLRVLKCEKDDIIRIIMRTKHGVTNILHEYPPKPEEHNPRMLSLDDSAATNRKNENNAEYERWRIIRDVDGLKLIDVLLNDLPIDEVH